MYEVAAPYTCLTPVLLVETQSACSSSTLVLLTLYVDVHLLPHALPDSVCGKAGVSARIVPAFGFIQSLDVAKSPQWAT